jgi:hypothetical protein
LYIAVQPLHHRLPGLWRTPGSSDVENLMAFYRSEKGFMSSFKRFNALFARQFEWQTGKSSKEHRCEFGHGIPPDTLYFKKLLDSEGEQKLRICRECMETLVHITVDSDPHVRTVTATIEIERTPVRRKTEPHIHPHR